MLNTADLESTNPDSVSERPISRPTETPNPPSKSILNLFSPNKVPPKDPLVATQEAEANEAARKLAEAAAKEKARLNAEKEERRLEAKFTVAERAELQAKKDAIKKKNRDKAAKEAADETVDYPERITKKTIGIFVLLGVLTTTLWLLAWAFPAFSAVIAAVVIGATVTTVGLFAYKLYLNGNRAAERINNIAINFEEEYLPEVLVQTEQTLGTIKQTAEATTATLVQIPKDITDIKKTFAETKEETQKALIAAKEEFKTEFNKLSKSWSENFTEVLITTETALEKATLALRQSAVRNNYEQNLMPVSLPILESKERADCMAGMFFGSKKTAYIAKNGSALTCRFLDDNNTVCTITLPLTIKNRSIETILLEDRGIILKGINLYIIRKDSEDNKASHRERQRALTPAGP